MKKLNLDKDYLFVMFDESPVKIQTIDFGFERCKFDREPTSQTTPFYTFYYAFSGKGYVKYENQPAKEIKAGQLICVFPTKTNIVHYPNKSKPWTYAWIGFTGQNITDLLSLLKITKESPIVEVRKRKEFEKILLNMLKDCTDNSSYNLYICNSYGHQCIAHLLKYSSEPSEKQTNANKGHINKARNFVDENYNDPDLHINVVSDYCGLNKAYFSRLFVKEIGVTFSSYLLNLRIRKATELFNNGVTSVQEAAYEVGFTSPYYFSNVFKDFHTIAPKTYIKQVKEKEYIFNKDKNK